MVTHTIFVIAIGILYPVFLTSILVLLELTDTERHILSLILSIVSIVCSHFGSNKVIKQGIGLGGTLQLMASLGYHWSFFDELSKITIYASTLLVLLYYAHYYLSEDQSLLSIIVGVAQSATYTVFVFTFIRYCMDQTFSDTNESHKRVILLTTSVLTIIGSSLFIKNATTRFGLSLGGFTLLIMTLFLNWNHYRDSEKLVIYGIPLGIALWCGNRSESDTKSITCISSLCVGILYNLFMDTLYHIIVGDVELKYILLLATSILTLYIATRCEGLNKYGLLTGGLFMLLVTSVHNFHHFSLFEVMLLIGFALLALLYFASKLS